MTRLTGLSGFSWRDVPPVIILFLAMAWGYHWWEQHERNRAPVEDYFEIRQLAVPDFHIGEDPKIVYDRSIHKPFRGEWAASLEVVGTLYQSCANSATVDYSPDRKLPDGGPSLSWFMGKPCFLTAGDYRLSVCWVIEREDATPAKLCKHTEPFTVREKPNEG